MANGRANAIVLMTLVFFLLHSNHYSHTMVSAYEQNTMGRNEAAEHEIKLLGGGRNRDGGGGHSSGDYGGGGRISGGYSGGGRSILGSGGGGRGGASGRGGVHGSFIPYHSSYRSRGGINTGQSQSLTITLTLIALCASLV